MRIFSVGKEKKEMAKFVKTHDCRNCSLKLNLFCFMTDDQLNNINDKRKEVQYGAGETIFKSGGPLTHIICITEGLVKIYLEGENDKRVLLNLVKPVQMIGGPGFLVDDRHYVTVTAQEETTACFIETIDYKEVMLANPEFSMELVKYLNKLIIKYFEKITSLTHKHMHGKLADSLLYLADEIYESDTFKTSLSRQDLADMSAMTKESAIRILKEFRDDGTISLNTTHFKILKKDVLRQISKNG